MLARAGQRGGGGVARADARPRRAACVHLIVNERARPAHQLPTPTRSCTRWTSCPAAIARERERFGAYATRTMGGNLLADLVQEEVRRRERIVADRRRGGADGAVRRPGALPADDRARGRPRARFEDDGPTGAAHAARRAAAAGARARRRAAAATSGCAPRRAAPSTSAGGSTSCPRLTHLAGLELGAGVHINIVAARARRRRAARALSVRALVQRVSRASVTVDGRGGGGDRARAARAARGARTTTPSARPTGWPTRSGRCGSSPTPRAG